jgi:hypothetical protein
MSWAAAKEGGRHWGLTGGESRVKERPREGSGNVEGWPSTGLGRPSRAGRWSMASGWRRRPTVSGLVAEEAVQGLGTGRAVAGRKAARV